LLLAAATAVTASRQPKPPADLGMVRPIDARDAVFMEDLTWMEVRDAIKTGKRTAIVATGGIEQNGPYLVTGKHNVVLRAMTESIARRLGDALVAPIVPFVPEGDLEPPSGQMWYPGSITVSEQTLAALLRDITSSLRIHGFRRIVFLADSGGNTKGMQRVATELDTAWSGCPAVRYIPEYYDYPGLQRWLREHGVDEKPEGYHDEYSITAMMATVDPVTIRADERRKKGLFSINAIQLDPMDRTIAMGRRLIDYRSTVTVGAIQKAFAGAKPGCGS
jgi:creatinine amidohydrolase/Fe(II)-dependent formamide hydrolase-like protein